MRRSSQQPVASSQEKTILTALDTGCWLLATAL
jgi:hypothetical protein